MTTRMTETNKWKDRWFRGLDSKTKLLFLYLCDNCDIAGFWEIDLDLAAFDTGILTTEIQNVFETISSRYIASENYVWLKNFLRHQRNYPLNPKNPCHSGIINRIKHHKELSDKVLQFLEDDWKARGYEGASKGLQRGYEGASKGLQRGYEGASKGLQSPLSNSNSNSNNNNNTETKTKTETETVSKAEIEVEREEFFSSRDDHDAAPLGDDERTVFDAWMEKTGQCPATMVRKTQATIMCGIRNHIHKGAAHLLQFIGDYKGKGPYFEAAYIPWEKDYLKKHAIMDAADAEAKWRYDETQKMLAKEKANYEARLLAERQAVVDAELHKTSMPVKATGGQKQTTIGLETTNTHQGVPNDEEKNKSILAHSRAIYGMNAERQAVSG